MDRPGFTVKPDMATGFLEPNGAGKSTTMRIIVTRGAPTSESATANDRAYTHTGCPAGSRRR